MILEIYLKELICIISWYDSVKYINKITDIETSGYAKVKVRYISMPAIGLLTAKISYDSTASTKLGTIETNADVTDTTNVVSSLRGNFDWCINCCWPRGQLQLPSCKCMLWNFYSTSYTTTILYSLNIQLKWITILLQLVTGPQQEHIPYRLIVVVILMCYYLCLNTLWKKGTAWSIKFNCGQINITGEWEIGNWNKSGNCLTHSYYEITIDECTDVYFSFSWKQYLGIVLIMVIFFTL